MIVNPSLFILFSLSVRDVFNTTFSQLVPGLKQNINNSSEKLLEEVNEYMENRSAEELADIPEDITALAGTHGLSFADLVKMAEETRRREEGLTRGLFSSV